MRTVVCFGDSNTWGYVPGSDGERFPREVRWPNLLQACSATDWDVIAEGLNGRTATIDRPDSEGRNGLPYLLPCLQSHAPVDVVVIFLGTNDVNFIDDDRVARCVARLVEIVRRCDAEPARRLPAAVRRARARRRPSREELDCPLIDLDGVASYPVVNGDVEHLDADGHAAVARAVAERACAREPRLHDAAAHQPLGHGRDRPRCGSTRSRAISRTSRRRTGSTPASTTTRTCGSCGAPS